MSRILIVDDQPHLRELFSLELLDDKLIQGEKNETVLI